MTVRDFARQVLAQLADPRGERRHTSIVEQELAEARAQRDAAIEVRDGVRAMTAELADARRILAELARVHRRYTIGDQSFCADYTGHNGNVPYPCPVRACIDGTATP